MIPGRIQGATRSLGAPTDWDDERNGVCMALPVRDVTRPDGVNQMISAWQPTPEELAALNAGASVWLSVVGTGHPPVWLSVSPPP